MKTAKSKARTIGKSRSRKKPMPELCVRYKDERGFTVQALAHLQVPSDGYLYLVWREGERVERRYLGKPCRDLRKEDNSSTTRGPAGGRGRRTRSARRRARAGRPL
jgi:hypothetical protein